MVRAIHLGVIPTLGPYYLPHVLPAIHEHFPNLRLLLREEMTPHVLAHLTEGKLEAGVLALPLPADDPSLEMVPLFCEPFMAAVPAGHRLATATEINLNELVDAGLFLLEEGHCLRNQALEACGLEGLANEEIRATSLETLRQMVGMGLGVTLIPALAGAQSHDIGTRVVLRPLAAPGSITHHRTGLAAALADRANDGKSGEVSERLHTTWNAGSGVTITLPHLALELTHRKCVFG